MYEDMFSKTFAQTETLFEPMMKANKLAVNNLEKFVSYQMSMMQSYVDMGLEQMKAAAEINSPQALQAFLGKQTETANVLRQKLLDDTKGFVDLGNGFKDEFTKLAEDNVPDFNKFAATTKKAA